MWMNPSACFGRELESVGAVTGLVEVVYKLDILRTNGVPTKLSFWGEVRIGFGIT